MVDELTLESYKTGKAVVEITVDLLKTLTKAIMKAVDNNQNNRPVVYKESEKKDKGEELLGEWAANKDLDTMDVADKDIASAFENKLKENGFKFERIGNERFVVESANRNVLNELCQETAKEVAKENAEYQRIAGDLMEERLQKEDIPYKRVDDKHFKYPENEKEKVSEIAKDVKKEINEKRAKKKESLKDKIQRNKQKAAKRDKNRQREKQKTRQNSKDAR